MAIPVLIRALKVGVSHMLVQFPKPRFQEILPGERYYSFMTKFVSLEDSGAVGLRAHLAWGSLRSVWVKTLHI